MIAHMEGPELLLDLAALQGAVHGQDRVDLVLAEGGRERDLLLGRRVRRVPVRRAEPLMDMRGEPFDRLVALLGPSVRHDDESGRAERPYADKPRPKRGPRLPGQGSNVGVPK